MRRKQSMQHLDQRQLLLLENAYYQVGIIFYLTARHELMTLLVQSAGTHCNSPEGAYSDGDVHTPPDL